MLDADTISSWLKAEGETLTLDEDAIKTYISDLANKYNTIYVPRTFHTSTGTDVTIEGMSMDTGSTRTESTHSLWKI